MGKSSVNYPFSIANCKLLPGQLCATIANPMSIGASGGLLNLVKELAISVQGDSWKLSSSH